MKKSKCTCSIQFLKVLKFLQKKKNMSDIEWKVLQLEFPFCVEEKYELSTSDIQRIKSQKRKLDEKEKERKKKEHELIQKMENNEEEDVSDDNDDEEPNIRPREDLSFFTQSIYYREISAHQVEVMNIPLASSDEELISLLKNAFSVFGSVMEIELPNRSQNIDNIIVTFRHSMALRRAVLTDEADSGQAACDEKSFGVNRYIEKFKRMKPSLEELESVSNKEIEAFEKQEDEARKRAGTSKVARHTEAEMKEIIEKYKQKEQQMFSKDFYGFQQKTLYTALLSEDDKPAPRHLKKQPKKKMQKPQKQTTQQK